MPVPRIGTPPTKVPSSLPPSGPAGGDLTGTYPNPTLRAPLTGGLTIQPATNTLTALVVNNNASGNVLTVRTTDNTVTASLLTMLGGITLATGSTTVFPIKFVAGPLLTVPVAGVMEFDGTDLYITV